MSLHLTNADFKDLEKVIKYIYLCLGKEEIPFQDLVFFISYDLKLVSPSTAEKILNAGKQDNYLSISKDKMVTFTLEKSGDGYFEVVNSLTEKNLIDKAFGVKKNQVESIKFDPKTGTLDATFISKDGIPIQAVIDPSKNLVYQEYDESIEDYEGKKLLLKFIVRVAMLHKEDEKFISILRRLRDSLDQWDFKYKKIKE